MDHSLFAEQTVKKRKHMIEDETINLIKTIPELSKLSKQLKEIVQGSIEMSGQVLMELEIFLKRQFITFEKGNICAEENVIRSVLTLMDILIKGKRLHEVYCYQPLMDNLVEFLELSALSNAIKDMIAHICEEFLIITIDLLNPECRVCLCTFNYILNIAINENNRNYKEYIHRLWKLKDYIKIADLVKLAGDKFQKLLLQTIITPTFIEDAEGQVIVAYILLNPTINLKSIRNNIYNTIPELSESQVSGYGEIYFNAWNIGEGSLKEQIEEVFIQDIMERAFKCERDEDLNIKTSGSKLFAILSRIHNHNIYRFKIKLTHLYKPLIWRYLHSHKSYERCNAAEILFKAFPFLESGEVRFVPSPLREKQIRCMLGLLADECADVRVIAVKGFCHCLSYQIDYFCDEHITKFLETILKKLLRDKSQEVRSGVFQGFELMTIDLGSEIILINLLPHIRKYINDESEKVRVSFLKFLIQFKENLPAQIDFGQVLPLAELISLLLNGTPVIEKLVVKLIMDYFYNKNLTDIISFSRLVRLTNFDIFAPYLLFTNSEGVIDADDAFTIISSVINKLHILHCTHLKENVKNVENPKKKIIEGIINQRDDAKELFSGSDDVPELINESRIISGLIMSVATLFDVFKDLRCNDSHKDSLYRLSIDFTRCFSQLYQGTPVYYAVLTYAANIPLAKLVPTFNIIDNCMMELKKVTEDTHIEIIRALSRSLVSWGRHEEVIVLVISWIDNSLNTQNLNVLKIKTSKTKKQHAKEGGKLTVALKLIHCIFDGSHCQYRLNENNNSLFNLLRSLDQVKLLIERRLTTKGSSTFNNESDQLLLNCHETLVTVQCYMPVTTTFDEPSGSKQFTVHAVLMEHVKWLNSYIVKYLSQKKKIKPTKGLPLTCLLQFFLMVEKHLQIKVADDEYIEAVISLLVECLNFECRYLLLEVSIELLKMFSDYTASLKSDDGLHLQVHTLPVLLNKILAMLKEGNLTARNVLKYCKDVDNMWNSLIVHLKCTKRCTSLIDFKNTLRTYISTVIDIIFLKEKKAKKIRLTTSVEDLPFVASYITKKLIEQNTFLPYIMTSIKELIANHNEDALFIRSCLSLLHTLVHCTKQKFSREEYEICLIDALQFLSTTVRTPSTSRSPKDLQIGVIVEEGKTIINLILSKLASSARRPPLFLIT